MGDDTFVAPADGRYYSTTGTDPNDLKPGIDYAIAKKVPLMPIPNPGGDESVSLLKKMKWLKGMVQFRVGEKREFKTGTWYPVTRIGLTELADTGQEFWINRNALCGSMLLPVGETKEVH